jgi:hypothetical protein
MAIFKIKRGSPIGGVDSSGKTSLTGRYELKEGSYEMNFNLIKRKFDIKSGSYILWTGNQRKPKLISRQSIKRGCTY